MPPYQGGGDMIASVTFEKTQYNQVPYKFEAGTPNIAGVIGLASAYYLLQSGRGVTVLPAGRFPRRGAECLALGEQRAARGEVGEIEVRRFAQHQFVAPVADGDSQATAQAQRPRASRARRVRAVARRRPAGGRARAHRPHRR